MAEGPVSFISQKIASIRRDGEERDAARRAEQLQLPYADVRKLPVALDAVRLIPEEDARAAQVAAVQLKGSDLAVIAFDPTSAAVQKLTQTLAEHYAVKVFVTSLSGLDQAWHFYQFVSKSPESITGAVQIKEQRMQELSAKLSTFEKVHETLGAMDFAATNTTALLETVLAGALGNRVSDIHLEAEEKASKIRFRIDGILHDIFTELPKKNYDSLISRIKLLSGLKINIHGQAQDGRFTVKVVEKDIEMRVSIIPSEFGENIVIRVLDPAAISVSLEQLGLRADDYAIVEEELKKPHGLIINTGPTGSGKTTTLYAFLRKMVSPEIKIITVEDPIEYRIEGIEQTQVDPEAGYTFASGLRAIVRQDPDAILVGEIRDLETADIALQAALTGHMVFSTLHANDAVGAVPRLVDIGVKTTTIGPALSLVIAQRLVRKLCEACKKPAEVPAGLTPSIEAFLNALPARVPKDQFKIPKLFAPVGCEKCSSFGYKGRQGIFEFLRGGPELEVMILEDASEIALREITKKQGMVTMQQDGILKALAGVTTFEEVESATGPIVW